VKRCSIYFLNVPLWKKIIKEREAISFRSGLTANIEIKESNTMLGLHIYEGGGRGEDLEVIINIIKKNSESGKYRKYVIR
jgi:hypothetical protein